MDFRESLYRMSLAGALGGLISWAAEPWVLTIVGLGTVPQEAYWIVQYIDLVLVALLISAFCIGFADYWSNRGVRLYRLAGGALASGIAVVVAERYLQSLRHEWLDPMPSLILMWTVSGASIGLVIGLLRYHFLLRRVLLSSLGGAAGAALGAWAAFSLGEILPYLTHALGLMITGCGVAFGSTAAVILFRKAQIRFTDTDDDAVASFFTGRSQVWELHRGDDYLVGKAESAPHVKQYIHIPDEKMAPLHAEIYEAGGNFHIRAHKDNHGPSKSPYHLSIKRSGDTNEMHVLDGVQLEPGANIEMGRTRFLFSFRGRDGFQNLILAAMMIGWVSLVSVNYTHAQTRSQDDELRFALVDKVRLYQCAPGSEQPCFRITVNVVNRNNDVVRIPVLNPRQATQQTQVLEDDSELKIICVDQGFRDGKPRRIAILLVDVSGSMLDSTVPGLNRDEAIKAGKTKFDAVKDAALNFAKDFEEGIDEITVIPFASRNVAGGVNAASFCSQKRCLEDRIKLLSQPESNANTGLYTAVHAAISRFQKIRTEAIEEGSPNPQSLLVVMTDGMNYVGGKNDDPDLLKDLKPVKDLAATAGIPIISVGFGDSLRIDENALQNLAWPTAANYLPARNTSELLTAFQKARALQLQRMQITFLPQQTLRGQLVKSHDYRVRFRFNGQSVIQGQFSWKSELGVPPFEGVLSSDEECAPPDGGIVPSWFLTYFGTLAIMGTLLYVLWARVPFWIWAEQHDLQVLRSRALSIRAPRQDAQGE